MRIERTWRKKYLYISSVFIKDSRFRIRSQGTPRRHSSTYTPNDIQNREMCINLMRLSSGIDDVFSSLLYFIQRGPHSIEIKWSNRLVKLARVEIMSFVRVTISLF